jgi:hypothetical protein
MSRVHEPWTSMACRSTMVALGLTEVMSFGRFGQRELAAMKGKGRGEWRSPHRGRNRSARRRGEASGEEEQVAAAAVVIYDGRLWSMERWRKRQHEVQ